MPLLTYAASEIFQIAIEMNRTVALVLLACLVILDLTRSSVEARKYQKRHFRRHRNFLRKHV